MVGKVKPNKTKWLYGDDVVLVLVLVRDERTLYSIYDDATWHCDRRWSKLWTWTIRHPANAHRCHALRYRDGIVPQWQFLNVGSKRFGVTNRFHSDLNASPEPLNYNLIALWKLDIWVSSSFIIEALNLIIIIVIIIIITIIIITPPRRSCVIVTVCLSVCHSVSRITHERVKGCRPNMVGMDKGWLISGVDPDPYVNLGSVFIPRQHTDARYWYSKSVRLSVCL